MEKGPSFIRSGDENKTIALTGTYESDQPRKENNTKIQSEKMRYKNADKIYE
ncbi:hypothetical protein [Bacillus sp. B15-48]|uniref:hypothetical protein n=1 Tax=Bacillus sp. B15-48 TaxID=1548601 RepID=UPI00193FED97|nr:hypothetical protein [Bacillus sp. B15-48]MBM4763704.1 hypothetical protein [Bacillus sp. B15-48]